MDEDSSSAGDDEGDGDNNGNIASNDEITMEEYELHKSHKKFALRQLPSKGLSFQVWPAASALCWFLDEFFWHYQSIVTFTKQKQVDVAMNESERSSEIGQNLRISIEHEENDAPLNGSEIISESDQNPRVPTCIELEENDGGESPRIPTSIEQENDGLPMYGCELSLEVGQIPRTPPSIQQDKDDVNGSELSSEVSQSPRTPPSIQQDKDDVNGSELSSEVVHIACCLLARRGERKAFKVLELGAGTGMVGIAAALLGAQVIITDLPHVLPNLEFNASANKDAVVATELGGSVCVRALRWGIEEDALEVGSNFDLVLASDVVYNEDLFDSLLLTMKWLLLSKIEEDGNPIMLMAHLRRWKKDARFFKKAKKFFDVRVVHRHPAQPVSRLGVIVYCFTKKN